MIFISYARENSDVALRLHRDLRAQGHSPWIDREDLLPGEPWKAAIRKAIRECSVFLALMSSRSVNKRGYAQKELRIAIDVLEEMPLDDIFVIPVRLDPCEPSHEVLRELTWVDLFPDYDQAFQRILKVLARKGALASRGKAGEKTEPAWKKMRDDRFLVVDGGAIEVAEDEEVVKDLFADEITIAGRVKGSVYALHDVEILKSGVVEGAIKCTGRAVISGRVEGEVWAGTKLEIRSSGHLDGDVKCPVSAIGDGAFFKGKVLMVSKGEVFPESALAEIRKKIGGLFPRDDRQPIWSEVEWR